MENLTVVVRADAMRVRQKQYKARKRGENGHNGFVKKELMQNYGLSVMQKQEPPKGFIKKPYNQ